MILMQDPKQLFFSIKCSSKIVKIPIKSLMEEAKSVFGYPEQAKPISIFWIFWKLKILRSCERTDFLLENS